MRKACVLIISAFMLLVLAVPAFSGEAGIAVFIPVTVNAYNDSGSGKYTVALFADNLNYPMPEGSVDGKSKLLVEQGVKTDFGAIRFVEPGNYTYTVQQEPTSDNSIVYDDTIYEVTICVTFENDELQAVVLINEKGQDSKSESLIFANDSDSDYKDFFVTKLVDRTEKVKVGSTLVYTIQLKNTGTFAIKNIRIRDYIPSNTTYVVDSATNGGEYGRIDGKDHITWNIALLNVGQTMNLSFKVTVNECVSGTIIKNAALYSANDETSTNDPDDPEKTSNTVSSSIKTSFIDILVDPNGPFTGDNGTMYFWIVLMAVSAAGICVISYTFLNKKRKESDS